jgi:DNA-directed RNA polymerase specialized sigma24 family protein
MERTLDPARLGDHLDRLYRAAWALCGSREEAEDLVQETYARLLARPRLLRNEDDLGYLLRALRNTFLNQKRTESRRLRPGPLPSSSTSSPTRGRFSRRLRSRPASSTRQSPRSRAISATSSSPSISPASRTRRQHAPCTSARAR